MMSKPKINTVVVLGLACLAWAVMVTDRVDAVPGVSESPLFNLNTLWATGVEDRADVPGLDRLGDCYPNPFNPMTTINYDLARPATVSLNIYDLQGRLVRVLLANESLAPGTHQAEWDGRDGRGNGVAAGVYLYRLVTENFVGSRRMTLVK